MSCRQGTHRREWSMSWQTGEKVDFPDNLRRDISVIVPCQQSALYFKICVKRTPGGGGGHPYETDGDARRLA